MKIWKVLVFLVGVGVLFNFIIPPFQNPDEPLQFGNVMIYARGEVQKDSVEKDIIHLMDKHNWWKFVGMGRPEALPDKLSDIPFLMAKSTHSDFRQRIRGIVLYHIILGKMVSIFFEDNIAAAYYFCRLISFLLIFGAVTLIAISIKKIAGGKTQLFSWSLLFVLFLPQFLLNIVSVSSDTLAIFIGSVFFFSAVSLLMGEIKYLYYVLIYISVIAGFLADRSTFPLLPLSIILPFFLFQKKKYKEYIVYTIAFFTAIFMLSTVFFILFPVRAENSIQLFLRNLSEVGSALPGLFSFNNGFKYFVSLSNSFLLKFGWACFGTGKLVYWLWQSVIIITIVGVIGYIAKFISSRVQREKSRFGTSMQIKLVSYFLVAVIFQLLAIWTYYGSHGHLTPQGRYFFPLILPIAFLFTLGLKTFGDLICKGAGKKAVAVFVLVEFIFLNYCIWNYIVPVFHLMIKSPHAGV